ncbi:VOC family protein [Paenibacillus sp. NFR01]|uniref:VOC family protein n=1 Tax=Paenibacillus sp. NFR01 TaxID=1566279 RepID=UPI0008C67CC7|nr:VOC family protein [Paenibacillus sp. NFR01]SET46018.1 PhnB protein [Paenibacillus sp. NFR01]
MAINVYLNFDGNTREAVEFYAKVFETETPQMMTFGDSPQDPSFPLPEEAKNRIMHARLEAAGGVLMFSDTFPGMPFTQGNNISLTVTSPDEESIKTWFAKLSDGGKVNMELQKTFWSNCYGSLRDKFGIEWQLSCD